MESKNLKKKKSNSQKQRVKKWLPGSGVWGNRERLLNGYKLSAVRRIRSEKLMQNMVTIVNVSVLNRFSHVQFFVTL